MYFGEHFSRVSSIIHNDDGSWGEEFYFYDFNALNVLRKMLVHI